MSLAPASKNKLQSFITSRNGPSDINPLGPGSPPRQAIADAPGGAASVSSSADSPLGTKFDKNFNSLKLPLNPTRNSRLANLNGNGVMGPPGTPPIKSSSSQPLLEARFGWESAPPGALRAHLQRDENQGGLRERWEEQSNMPSILSESEPPPDSAHQDLDVNGDTQSDILVNRARPQIGRAHRKNSDSSPYVGRNRAQHTATGSSPALELRNGKLQVKHTLNDPKAFSASMITHAPRVGAPEPSVFREDPFGSVTSGQTSPQPERNAGFLHSSFPYRTGDVAKGLSHFERAAFHAGAARNFSPEKHDGLYASNVPRILAQQDRVQSISDHHPPIFPGLDDPPTPSSDPDDSDPEELNQHEPTSKAPKAALKSRTHADNTTVVFNPQRPIEPPRPQKSVTLKEEVLQISPMSRFIEQRSPSRKRRRSIDYDDSALQQMSFADLQNEPFDHDPTREVPESPAKPPADNLNDRMRFYSDKSEEAQAKFFTDMPVQDWEESGDWFLDRFGDIVRRMKEARQAKRKLVQQFEIEISNREDEVRRKKDSIERKMFSLRRDSSAMMKGKELEN